MKSLAHLKSMTAALGGLVIAAAAPAAAQDGAAEALIDTTQTEAAGEAADARELVQESSQVVEQMKKDPELLQQMKQAKGIFIMPDFGRAAAAGGVRGGSGVMLTQRDSTWSDPVFYDMGGISVGAQAGVSGGTIAMLLMTQDAVDSFLQENNWSLNADAGLTIIDWSAHAQASAGKGDVVVWSDTDGLFAGIEISVSDVTFDEEETRAYYGKARTPRDVVQGKSSGNRAAGLKQELPQS